MADSNTGCVTEPAAGAGVTPATGGVVDSTIGAVADPATSGVADSTFGAAADPVVDAGATPVAGRVVDPSVNGVAETDVEIVSGPSDLLTAVADTGKVPRPADRIVADPAFFATAASTLDAPANLATRAVANFILIGAADPTFGIMDDIVFDAVAVEEIISTGTGNENIRISSLKKKDKNTRRIAEMR